METESIQSVPEPEAEERGRFRPSPGFVVVSLVVLLAIVVGAGLLISRNTSAGSAATDDGIVTIDELRKSPETWNDQTVVLQGTAQDVRSIPYLDQYALYKFKDATGDMWVLSRNGAPADGEQIRLEAIYHSQVSLEEALKQLVNAKFGGLIGTVARNVLPDLALDVVYLQHTGFVALD